MSPDGQMWILVVVLLLLPALQGPGWVAQGACVHARSPWEECPSCGLGHGPEDWLGPGPGPGQRWLLGTSSYIHGCILVEPLGRVVEEHWAGL